MHQIDGSAVRYVSAPRDLDELCELMATAQQRELVVLPRGSGSKLSWLELPSVIDVVVDMGGFAGCRFDEDTAEVTVGAGLPVAVLQDELARSDARVALDPPSPSATVGGALVAGEAGPLAHVFGPPAAHVVDATVVLPDGTLTRVGERVPFLGNGVCDLRWAYPGWPNAACAVVEITMRTHPLPQAQTWLTYPVSQPMHVGDLLAEIEAANVASAAIELDLPGIRMGAVVPGQRHATGALSVLFEGSEASVLDRSRDLANRLGSRAHLSGQMPQWWGRYPFRPGEIAVRLNTPDGQLHLICYALADAAGAPVPVRGSLGAGPAWASLPGDIPARQLVAILEAVRGVMLARGGSAIVQAAPVALREVVAPYRHP